MNFSSGMDLQKITSDIYHNFWVALDWVFPPECLVCKKCGYRICPECLDGFKEIDQYCEICGRSVKIPIVCKECNANKPSFDKLRSLFEYKDNVRNAVHQIKFHNDLGLAELLGEMMNRYLNKLNWQIDLIVPLPLNERRQSQRGYNQSVLLALPIALNSGIKFAPFALERIKDTRSQVGLNATERLMNVSEAFVANRKIVNNKNLLIIDDVVTTGATMNAAAIAVKKGGAEKVYCLSFARAGKHNLDII